MTYETRDDVPPCTYCEGTGVIQGMGMLPDLECHICLGTKKDMDALKVFYDEKQRREPV